MKKAESRLFTAKSCEKNYQSHPMFLIYKSCTSQASQALQMKIFFRFVISYQVVLMMTQIDILVSSKVPISLQNSKELSKNLSSSAKTKDPCPKYCLCSYSPDGFSAIEVDCSFAMLNSVPTIPKINHVQSLNLMGNMIQEAGREFYDLVSMKNLDLSFNRISYLRQSAFKTLDVLERLSLDFNNLTEIPAAALLRMPNSTSSAALSVSVLANPIPCSCALINIYNSVLFAKPHIREFQLSCTDELEANRGTYGVNFSRTFPFMEASGGRFGTAALSPHVSLAQFASNNCAEVLLTPQGQKDNQKTSSELPYLEIGMMVLFIVVFLIFVSLVLYFVIFKTCQHWKRRSSNRNAKITENHLVQSESNGQLGTMEDNGIHVIKEFQLNYDPTYDPEPLINVTNNPNLPPKPPKRSSITKLAPILSTNQRDLTQQQIYPSLSPSHQSHQSPPNSAPGVVVQQKPPIPPSLTHPNLSSDGNPKWPPPKPHPNGVPNGILKKPPGGHQDNSNSNCFFPAGGTIPNQAGITGGTRKLNVPTSNINPNEHHYSTLSYKDSRPPQRQKSPTGSLQLQIEIKPNVPPRTSGLFMQTSV